MSEPDKKALVILGLIAYIFGLATCAAIRGRLSADPVVVVAGAE